MATYFLDQIPTAEIDLTHEAMSEGPGLAFHYLPDMAGVSTVAIDDIIIIDAALSRRLYKGVVRTIEHSLSSEQVQVFCDSAASLIDGQVWDAVNEYYNMEDPICLPSLVEQTIADFFTIEFVGDVANWFTSYTIPASIADLQLPALATTRKGFMTCLKDILAKYPFIQFVVEYSPDHNALFPVGGLILLDTRAARSTHALAVGGATPRVLDFSLTQNGRDTAETVRVFARGHFVERFEFLQPDWAGGSRELIREENISIDGPTAEGGSIHLPEGHTFIRNLRLWSAGGIEIQQPPGHSIIGDTFRLWPGADYEINCETGEIRFLVPEDGEDWWWVHMNLGYVKETVGGSFGPFSNLEGAFYRRPIAFDNNHMKPTGFFFATQYDRIADDPYRTYTTEYPIADLRLEEVEVEEDDPDTPGETIWVKKIRKAPESITVFTPKYITEHSIFEEDDTKTPDAQGFFGDPTSAEHTAWKAVVTASRDHLKQPVDPSILEGYVKSHPVEQLAFLMTPKFLGGVVPAFDEVVRFYNEGDSGVTFEEGTVCVKLSKRQLISIPQWFDQPNQSRVQLAPGLRTDWATWPILVRYTSWHEVLEQRTNTRGSGRVYTAVANSSLRYDISTKGVTPEVLVDTIAYSTHTGLLPEPTLADYATELAAFLDDIYWEGSVVVHLDYDSVEDRWSVPYKVGDTITLTGNVSGVLTTFVGLINGLDYRNINGGTLTLTIGRREPLLHPLQRRQPRRTDIEGDNLTGPDLAGLQQL